jgi:hypothetical protein
MIPRRAIVAVLAILPCAGTRADICHYRAPDGRTVYADSLPPGIQGRCVPSPGPAAVAEPVPGSPAWNQERAREKADHEYLSRQLDDVLHDMDVSIARDRETAAQADAARAALERAADPDDQSITSLILRARAHRRAP